MPYGVGSKEYFPECYFCDVKERYAGFRAVRRYPHGVVGAGDALPVSFSFLVVFEIGYLAVAPASVADPVF